MRGRGSKHAIRLHPRAARMSPPMRGRGSKLSHHAILYCDYRRPPCGGVDRNLTNRAVEWNRRVAPHAGAWIETGWPAAQMLVAMSPPMRGRGSKPLSALRLPRACGRPPCGGVDRNNGFAALCCVLARRPPCGGVDRNSFQPFITSTAWGRPPCGGVDRNVAGWISLTLPWVAPHAGAWIETLSLV